MPPHSDDGWSDEDEDDPSEIGTSVLLGVPDGPIESPADMADAAVSRLGGYPALLPMQEPSISSAQCKNCSFPMELLVQLWCPLENSPMDRAVYIWACARSGCQKKEGSVRAWRGLRFNDSYAAKLEKKLALQKEKEINKAAELVRNAATKNAQKVNPFSMNSTAGAAANPFSSGLGTTLFGGQDVPAESNDKTEHLKKVPVAENEDASDSEHESDTSGPGDDTSDSELITALASTSIKDSPWQAAPAYLPALYLSTSGEYLPPLPKSKHPAPDLDAEDEGKGKDASWAFEGYENSLDVDHVFERFVKRVGFEGGQCVRYELGGTPLPYASDAVFPSLFPLPPSTPLPITRPDSKVITPMKRTYSPQGIAPCPHCGAKRVFECQLMPNLINVLKSSTSSSTDAAKSKVTQTDEERRKEVERVLKGGALAEGRGMEWGTCFMFSCEQDCCVRDGDVGGGDVAQAKECWREEVVLVQWDE